VSRRATATATQEATCKLRVACECSDSGCDARPWVRFHHYEYASRRPQHYVVAPGHGLADALRVVIRDDDYEVVCAWR
jgi:hypothetical protein